MLDVFCSESELGEYGEVIAVGDRVRRSGSRSPGSGFGTGLDEVEYRLDRYAGIAGEAAPLVISGEVDALAAIFVRLALIDGAWRPRPGSALLEPVRSTARTRRPPQRIAWTTETDGRAWGRLDPRDGDELLAGWRITLADAVLEA